MSRWLFVLLCAPALFAQSNTGELHLRVTDPAGLGLKSLVELVSEANHYQQSFLTDVSGTLVVKRLPFGRYIWVSGKRTLLLPHNRSKFVRRSPRLSL